MRMLVEFRKDDIVRHLGLLDLQRTMQRALRRSGLPIKYSSGFNPHIVMSFASALSTGIPGDAELLDVSLSGEVTERECLEAMNRVLPPSLPVTRVRLVEDGFPKVMAALRQAEYRIRLSGEGTDAIVSAIPAFLAETEIMAMRKSKRGEALVNIRPCCMRSPQSIAAAKRLCCRRVFPSWKRRRLSPICCSPRWRRMPTRRCHALRSAELVCWAKRTAS